MQASQKDQSPPWRLPQVNSPDSLAGDVYGLTVEDARTVAMSDQIRGNVSLTYTYAAGTFPFIIIPISHELSDQLASQRPKIL
jgi:hypothetical protein